MSLFDEEEKIEITYVCAVKRAEKLRVADLVTCLDLDGNYIFNLKNISFLGRDRKGFAYEIDLFGNPRRLESANFEEDMVIEDAESFEELTEKLDRRIQKRLIWMDDARGGMICMGIR